MALGSATARAICWGWDSRSSRVSANQVAHGMRGRISVNTRRTGGRHGAVAVLDQPDAEIAGKKTSGGMRGPAWLRIAGRAEPAQRPQAQFGASISPVYVLFPISSRPPVRNLPDAESLREAAGMADQVRCHGDWAAAAAQAEIAGVAIRSAGSAPAATASSSATSASGASSMTSWPQAISLVVQPRACARW
jgi:hypothetical protein